MKIRAAVLEEFGQPLVVQEIELAEPREGEVLVRLVACGVCHTDLYTASGADPSGYAPTVLGHEGAGVVERVGEGVSLVSPGDHVVTLFSPSAASASTASAPGRTSAWRSASSRARASCRRHRPALARRRADPPLHGHVDLRRVHGDARDRAGQDRRRKRRSTAPRCSPAGSRPASARRSTRPRWSRARPASCSARGWSASARSPAAACRAPSGSSASTSPRSGSSWPAARARPTRCSAARTWSSGSSR